MRDPSFVNLQALPGDGARPPARRLHRVRRDARPDPRRGGPVSGGDGGGGRGALRRAARLGRGRATSRRTRRRSRTRPRSRSRTSCGPRSSGSWRSIPTATRPRCPRSARRSGCTAGARPRRSPGGRGDAGDARLPVERGDLLRHAAHRAGRQPLRVRVHERRLPPAQRQAVYERIATRPRRQGLEDVELREFECLGACDMAPMASVDGRYVGPLSVGRAAASSSAPGEGRPRAVLPGRGLGDPGSGCPARAEGGAGPSPGRPRAGVHGRRAGAAARRGARRRRARPEPLAPAPPRASRSTRHA